MSELKAIYAYTSDEIDTLYGHAEGNEYYLKSEADKVIAEKDKKIVELQSKVTLASLAEDCSNLRNKRCNYSSALLKLMSEVRRLKRALYKALANWAHEAKFDYDDEFSRWDNMEQKCLIKVEELK